MTALRRKSSTVKKSGKNSSCNRSSSCHHCSCKTPGLAQQVAYCSLHWPHLGGLWRYWFLTWQVWTLQCAFITMWVILLAHCAQSQSFIATLLLPLSSPAGFLFSPRHPEISKEGMISWTPFSHSEVSSSTWAYDSAGRVHSPGGNSECWCFEVGRLFYLDLLITGTQQKQDTCTCLAPESIALQCLLRKGSMTSLFIEWLLGLKYSYVYSMSPPSTKIW